MELKVGDKVRLVGPEWNSYGSVQVGSVVLVDDSPIGVPWSNVAGALAQADGSLFEGYEIEKVGAGPIHSLASVTEGIRELIGVLESTGLDPEDAKSIILANIEARL